MDHWAIQGDSEDDPEVAALGGESKKKYLGAPKSGHGGEFQLPLLWFDDSPWMSSQLACDHLDSEKGMRFTPLKSDSEGWSLLMTWAFSMGLDPH